ncbi:MAG: O-antigen ligase family protein [Chitinophagales bacterium]
MSKRYNIYDKNTMNKLSIIDKYAARLLMVSFFLPMKLQVWAVMAVSVYFVSRTFTEKERIPRSNFVWALILGSGYLLYLFSIPMTPVAYRAVLLTLCEHKVSFLLMPFVFAIITPRFGELIRRELTWFVYVCFIVCVAGNAAFLYAHYFINGDYHSLSHVVYRTNFYHYTGLHPTYMAMYLSFSICILLLSGEFNSRTEKIVKYALLYSMFIFSLALLAKSPLIALIIIFIHYSYVHRKTLYKYKILFAGLPAAVAAAWFFIPFVSQRINEALQFFGYGKSGNVADNSVYARKLIWSIDTGLLKDYWLTGIGPGRLIHALHERYFFYSLCSDFPVAYYDPHNEYFYEWLSFGILGIVVFLGIFLVYLIKAIRVKDHLNLYLLIILYITFFTETVLSLQRGILFYAVFTAMMFYPKPLKGLRL